MYAYSYACRLINLQLANPYNKLKNSMQHVAIAINHEYKHLAVPKIDITQFALQSVQLLSPIK